MKKLITGFTPTGQITIGNYLGVIKPLLTIQADRQLLLFSANLHAITDLANTDNFKQNSELIRKRTHEIVATLIACGINYDKNIIFVQGDNSDHYKLFYYFVCLAKMGQLKRMIQFKEISKNQATSPPAGILTYPCMMAADILLYRSDYVFVGEDQRQHLELCAALLHTWKQKTGSLLPFKAFETLTSKQTAHISALDNPCKKMSKSSKNPFSYISMFDNPEMVSKKITRATTDSENQVRYRPQEFPGISNLLIIYSEITDTTIKKLEKQYQQSNYAIFKQDLIKVVNNFLSDFQHKFAKYNDKNLLDKILLKSVSRLKNLSTPIINRVSQLLGIS